MQKEKGGKDGLKSSQEGSEGELREGHERSRQALAEKMEVLGSQCTLIKGPKEERGSGKL